MAQYIGTTKIETYNVSPQALSTGLIYNPTGTYNINNQNLTEAQVIARFDLILILGVFYIKPFITISIGVKNIVKKFVDDATMNSWITTNLTPLNFLVIWSTIII